MDIALRDKQFHSARGKLRSSRPSRRSHPETRIVGSRQGTLSSAWY